MRTQAACRAALTSGTKTLQGCGSCDKTSRLSNSSTRLSVCRTPREGFSFPQVSNTCSIVSTSPLPNFVTVSGTPATGQNVASLRKFFDSFRLKKSKQYQTNLKTRGQIAICEEDLFRRVNTGGARAPARCRENKTFPAHPTGSPYPCCLPTLGRFRLCRHAGNETILLGSRQN